MTDQWDAVPFMKMHGLGNDFVVVDRRSGGRSLTPAQVAAIGDRRRGIGFDQLAEIHADEAAAARLVFWNADGSRSGACGNATRCVARHLFEETGAVELTLVTERGRLRARDAGAGLTAVDMGAPILDWRRIPLAQPVDLDRLPIPGAPVATGMGNPHCTFFVDDVGAVDLESFGAAHERHPLFPERTNVQVAHLAGPDRIRMRVWERGVGVTLASGSSACASAVAAVRRGLTGRRVTVELDGGILHVDWAGDGVWMTGPTAHVATGTLTPRWLEAAS